LMYDRLLLKRIWKHLSLVKRRSSNVSASAVTFNLENPSLM
jgi:hypothetical protein